MNICFFSIVTYWHGLKGGMDLHGRHLLEGLVKKGHEVIVISTKHPSGKKYENISGIKLHYLENTTFGSPRKGWKKGSLRAFEDILKGEEIDLVVSQSKAGYGVVKVARAMGIPFVAIMHGYETMICGSVLNQVMNFKKDYLSLFKSLLAALYYSLFQEYPLLVNSSRTIAVSDKVAEVLGRRPLVERKKISVVNCGIDLEVFGASETKRRKTRTALNLLDDDRVILFLSLISKQKGADVAIRAFEILSQEASNIKLIVAGDGDYLPAAKQLAEGLDIADKVIFPGFVRNEDTSLFYNASDVFIFPTLRLESFGIVIAEAMACGKPVIASNIGSIPNVIDNGVNGILIPPGDFRELANQIKRLFNDRMYSKALSEKAQLKANERFGLNRMVERTIEVFESAIGDELKGAAS
jgi:glycosyltransferase involved in cell wall biosynthesis